MGFKKFFVKEMTMLKVFVALLGAAFALNIALANELTLKIEVDTKVVDSFKFDVSKGKTGLAEVVYNYCSKPPKKVATAMRKAKWLSDRLTVSFGDTNNIHGTLSHAGFCTFDTKGKLTEIDGYDVKSLSKDELIAKVADNYELQKDIATGVWMWKALEAFAEHESSQKK